MSNKKLRAIRRTLFRSARALDVARWNYHFEDGDVRDILKALACYQNNDGGFAYGLEPDARTAESSPMATWTATRLLRETGLPATAESLIEKLLDYLESSLGPDNRWSATVPAFNQDRHAPWFHHIEGQAVWGWNPTIELAAFILITGRSHPALYARAEEIIREAIPQITAADYAPPVNELSNVAEAAAILLETRPDLLPQGFREKISDLILRQVTRDPAAYEGQDYITSPDYVLNSPQSPWYPALRETADFYADFLEASARDEGYWELRWDWGGMEYPPDIQREWQGALTLSNMLYLQHFKPEQDEAGKFLKRVLPAAP